MNGYNKLRWKGFTVTNTLSYWAHAENVENKVYIYPRGLPRVDQASASLWQAPALLANIRLG